MGIVSDYRALVTRHVQEIQAWADASPANLQAFRDHNGRDTVAEYIDDYSDKFAITGYLATDLQMPTVARMMQELSVFDELAELMD